MDRGRARDPAPAGRGMPRPYDIGSDVRGPLTPATPVSEDSEGCSLVAPTVPPLQFGGGTGEARARERAPRELRRHRAGATSGITLGDPVRDAVRRGEHASPAEIEAAWIAVERATPAPAGRGMPRPYDIGSDVRGHGHLPRQCQRNLKIARWSRRPSLPCSSGEGQARHEPGRGPARAPTTPRHPPSHPLPAVVHRRPDQGGGGMRGSGERAPRGSDDTAPSALLPSTSGRAPPAGSAARTPRGRGSWPPGRAAGGWRRGRSPRPGAGSSRRGWRW